MIKVIKLFLRLIFSRFVTTVCGTRIRRYSFSSCSGLIKRWRGTIINVSELFYLWSGNNAPVPYPKRSPIGGHRCRCYEHKTYLSAACTISKNPPNISCSSAESSERTRFPSPVLHGFFSSIAHTQKRRNPRHCAFVRCRNTDSK